MLHVRDLIRRALGLPASFGDACSAAHYSRRAEDRIVRREIFVHVDQGISRSITGHEERAGMGLYCDHLCEPCAENRSNAHEPVERLYPEPVESACADCGAHSFRPWTPGYDDAFTEEGIILGLLPAAERSRQAGTVMYEAVRYPMVVSGSPDSGSPDSGGPESQSYRVHSDAALFEWANRRFADWEIVAGRRRGWEHHGVVHAPLSEAELVDSKSGSRYAAGGSRVGGRA